MDLGATERAGLVMRQYLLSSMCFRHPRSIGASASTESTRLGRSQCWPRLLTRFPWAFTEFRHRPECWPGVWLPVPRVGGSTPSRRTCDHGPELVFYTRAGPFRSGTGGLGARWVLWDGWTGCPCLNGLPANQWTILESPFPVGRTLRWRLDLRRCSRDCSCTRFVDRACRVRHRGWICTPSRCGSDAGQLIRDVRRVASRTGLR
jgi:hypothetical protein